MSLSAGLNLSNAQIAEELDLDKLDKDDVQHITRQLRSGVVELKPEPQLAGSIECDEVYLVASHKGHPAAVKKRVVTGRSMVTQSAFRILIFGRI